MKKTKLTRSLLAACSIVALTAVMYGCSSGPSQSELDAEMERAEQAEMQVTMLQGQINALRMQLGLDADADLGDNIEELQNTVTSLQKQIADAAEAKRMAEEKAAAEAAAKTGKELFAALAGLTDDTTDALDNIGAPALAATGLTIDAATGAGALPDATNPDPVILEAGDSAGSLGDWMGTNYAHMDAGTKIENAAVVYNNQGPGDSELFGDVHTVATDNAGTAPAFTAIKGSLTVVSGGTVDSAADITKVKADRFMHSGTQNHPIPSRSDALYVRGTYDGAPGEYRCTGTCSSTNDGMGSPSELGGTWHFKPDAGAMVAQPDTTYLYYGWWVSKDEDGMPTAASAFTGVVAADQAAMDALRSGSGADLTGGATYVGHAAGKFALDYSQNKVLDGTSDGGHFTADATLMATFGSGATAGMIGTIDNFMANGESVPWSVALHRAGWAADGAISAPADVTETADVDESNGTTWSIDGTSAPASGTWSGQMYDEMPGNAPDGDGSDVPTTVTGTFYSEFDSVGRMAGAFGADKQ